MREAGRDTPNNHKEIARGGLAAVVFRVSVSTVEC